jgi:hypothetical protein
VAIIIAIITVTVAPIAEVATVAVAMVAVTTELALADLLRSFRSVGFFWSVRRDWLLRCSL